MTDLRSSSDPLLGRVIGGDFELTAPLGEGGMGSVYVATQRSMGRRVVVKTIRPELVGDEETVERFRRESQAVARLNHPNIVQVYAFGEMDGGGHYLVMEHIEGRSLDVELARCGRMSEARARHIGEQIAAALASAHAAGIVHRDLKPSNVMLSSLPGRADHVRVLDFGIAKLTDGSAGSALTGKGVALGTPAYMSPEQLKGRQVDGRADLYALGLVLYELVAGTHAFDAETPQAFYLQHVSEPLPAISTRAPGVNVSPSFEALLLRCTAKEPSERPARAEDVQFALTGQSGTTELPATPAETAAAIPTLVTAPVTRRTSATLKAPLVAVGVLGVVAAVLFGLVLAKVLGALGGSDDGAQGQGSGAGVAEAGQAASGGAGGALGQVAEAGSGDAGGTLGQVAEGASDAGGTLGQGAAPPPTQAPPVSATVPAAAPGYDAGSGAVEHAAVESPKPEEVAVVQLVPAPPQGIVVPQPPAQQQPAVVGGWTAGAYGAPVPADATVSLHMDTLVQIRTARSFDEVADHYQQRFGAMPGMMTSRTNQGSQQVFSVIDVNGSGTFRMISAISDPRGTVISVFPP